MRDLQKRDLVLSVHTRPGRLYVDGVDVIDILDGHKRRIVELEAERDAALALAPRWRPMSEAPRDGTRLILRPKRNPVCEGEFFGGERWSSYPVDYFDSQLDGWMPLPEPPAEEVVLVRRQGEEAASRNVLRVSMEVPWADAVEDV